MSRLFAPILTKLSGVQTSDPQTSVAGALRPILITFAIPHESSDLRQRCLASHCQVVHTGIGLQSAATRIEQALQREQPELLISGGFAGGLDPELRVAELVADSRRSCPALLARIHESVRRGEFLSVSSPLETVAAKSVAFRDTGALAVDMETEAIARACSAAGVPALFIRAISDAAADEIPLPFEASYDLRLQRPRPLGVCLALLRRPAKLPRFVRFLRDLKTARATLTRAVWEVLENHSAAA